MSDSGGWRDRAANIHPIKLINRIFALLVAILLVQTVFVSVQSVRDIRNISERAVDKILEATQHETDDILAIMKNPTEIYTVDPLLEAAFHNLKDQEGIHAKIIQSETEGLPEGLHSTPEKVEYWIDTYKGEHRISRKIESEIRPFLPFLKAREVQEEEEHGEGEIELEKILPQDEYDKQLAEIKTKYKQIVTKPMVDIYFNKEGGLIDVYAAFKRNHKQCVGCHGYLGDRPALIHFSKDLQPEIAAEKHKGLMLLLRRAQGLVIVIAFYVLSYFLLRAGLSKREEQRENMEKALEASVDVLKSLRSSPRPMPFFVSSPSYLRSVATGGGDSVHWHNYRFRYAGYCLHDVSGHDIQETLLNIYVTAIAGSCKINSLSKQVATPATFLTNLNRKVSQFCNKTPAYSAHFLTVIKVLMDFTMKKMIISLAGHPRPLLIRPDGTSDWVGEAGLLLGQFEVDSESDCRFVDTDVWLAEGEILLVYSDGLMEQKNRNGVMFSKLIVEKVASKLAGKEPNEAYKLLKEELETHLRGTAREDDISFTFFGSRPISRYETCQYLFSENDGQKAAVGVVSDGADSTKGEQHKLMVRGLNYNGQASEEVFKPEIVYDRILENLRSNDWREEKISGVKLAIDEVLTKVLGKRVESSGEMQISISHIYHDEVLEIEINCVNSCFGDEMLSTGGDDLLSRRYGSSLLVAKAVAEAVYFCESGDTCWLLFKKSRPLSAG